MARVLVIERVWGQDELARLHRPVGFGSFNLMLAHIVLIGLDYAGSGAHGYSGLLGELWDITWGLPGMLLAVAGALCLVLVVVTSIRAARRRLRYESWHLMHLYAYLGVVLALPHQLWTGGDFLANPLATAYWWTAWAGTAAAVIVFRLGLLRGPGARGDRADQSVLALYADLRRADRVFSTYRRDSEISLLRSGALSRELASPDMREVLELCAQARTLTGGFFDAEPPQPGGRRQLDPSGLVKGWAVERAARGLDLLEGLDWLVNAGGDVLGRANHGPAWRIAVEDPRDRTRVLCVLPLRNGAVATSGTAAHGRHIIDPRTGSPAADHSLSATVVGPSLTWADVLATAAFVQGPTALARVADLPNYEALLVLPDGRRTATPGLTAQANKEGP